MFSKKTLVSIMAVVSLCLLCFGMISCSDQKSGESEETSMKKPGKGVTVQPARATWTSGFFLEALVSQGMEQLGYEVKDPKKLSVPMFYQSVVTGEVDMWANGWFPLHNEQLPDDFNKKARIVGNIVDNGAIQGYLVSKEHAEKYDITSINDFKRDEVQEAFDANGDGKADLVACPPGWGCEKVISHHMKDEYYGMKNFINPIKANYSASMADAISRYKEGKPIFFYTWTPNWTIQKLVPGEDVVWINVPEIKPTPAQEGLDDAMVAEDIKGAVSSPIKFGFVANDISTVGNKQFLKNNPAAEKFMSMVKVPLKEINAQNAKMQDGEDSQEDIERHAKNWIKDNQKQWDKWLNAAREAAASSN